MITDGALLLLKSQMELAIKHVHETFSHTQAQGYVPTVSEVISAWEVISHYQRIIDAVDEKLKQLPEDREYIDISQMISDDPGRAGIGEPV